LAVTALVVYVLPTRLPPHVPVTLTIWLLAFGVTVNAVVAPWFTVCGVFGVIVPLPVTLGVTVCVSIAKFAITVQSAVTALVVNVLLTRVPPHVPVTLT